MARAGSNAAISTTYVTLFDSGVDGVCGSFRVRNAGAVDLLLRVTRGAALDHVTTDFPLPVGENELFRGRIGPITKVEAKVAGGTGNASYGIVEA